MIDEQRPYMTIKELQDAVSGLKPVSPSWDKKLFGLAQHVATWSKDPSTQVGAVVVPRRGRFMAFGYNGFPPGIEDTPERLKDRQTKYRLIQHAERNALDNATFDVEGGTLYVTLFPCDECAKSIISKGIRRVVTTAPPEREPWATAAAWALIMFKEAGVDVTFIPVGSS